MFDEEDKVDNMLKDFDVLANIAECIQVDLGSFYRSGLLDGLEID